MSFPVDDFGMNIRAEVKAYNFGFSTAKNLASVIRANDKVTVVTFALPTHVLAVYRGKPFCNLVTGGSRKSFIIRASRLDKLVLRQMIIAGHVSAPHKQ